MRQTSTAGTKSGPGHKSSNHGSGARGLAGDARSQSAALERRNRRGEQTCILAPRLQRGNPRHAPVPIDGVGAFDHQAKWPLWRWNNRQKASYSGVGMPLRVYRRTKCRPDRREQQNRTRLRALRGSRKGNSGRQTRLPARAITDSLYQQRQTGRFAAGFRPKNHRPE